MARRRRPQTARLANECVLRTLARSEATSLESRGSARSFLVVDVVVLTLVARVLGGWLHCARYAFAAPARQRPISVKIVIWIGRKRIYFLGPASGFLSCGPLLIGALGFALCDPFECLGPRFAGARLSLQSVGLGTLLTHALCRSVRTLFQLSCARKGLLGLCPKPLSFVALPFPLRLAAFR